MKNDHRNDGSQSFAGFIKLADQGAAEAKYDSQGGVIFTDKTDKPDAMSRLAALFYEWGELLATSDGEARILAEVLEDEGFTDIAHQLKAGLRQRAKMSNRVMRFFDWNEIQATFTGKAIFTGKARFDPWYYGFKLHGKRADMIIVDEDPTGYGA